VEVVVAIHHDGPADADVAVDPIERRRRGLTCVPVNGGDSGLDLNGDEHKT
jgi:hypothetical protein